MPQSFSSIIISSSVSDLHTPTQHYGAGNETINCGEEVCLKIAKTSPIDVSLAYSIAKSYRLGGFRSAAEVFQAKIRS